MEFPLDKKDLVGKKRDFDALMAFFLAEVRIIHKILSSSLQRNFPKADFPPLLKASIYIQEKKPLSLANLKPFCELL